MTANDFRIIAATIANLRHPAREEACQEFADTLRVLNPRFDEVRFAQACHVDHVTLPAHRLRVGMDVPGIGTVREITEDTYPIGSGAMETRYTVRVNEEDPNYPTGWEFDRSDPLIIRVEN